MMFELGSRTLLCTDLRRPCSLEQYSGLEHIGHDTRREKRTKEMSAKNIRIQDEMEKTSKRLVVPVIETNCNSCLISLVEF